MKNHSFSCRTVQLLRHKLLACAYIHREQPPETLAIKCWHSPTGLTSSLLLFFWGGGGGIVCLFLLMKAYTGIPFSSLWPDVHRVCSDVSQTRTRSWFKEHGCKLWLATGKLALQPTARLYTATIRSYDSPAKLQRRDSRETCDSINLFWGKMKGVDIII